MIVKSRHQVSFVNATTTNHTMKKNILSVMVMVAINRNVSAQSREMTKTTTRVVIQK